MGARQWDYLGRQRLGSRRRSARFFVAVQVGWEVGLFSPGPWAAARNSPEPLGGGRGQGSLNGCLTVEVASGSGGVPLDDSPLLPTTGPKVLVPSGVDYLGRACRLQCSIEPLRSQWN